jgi:3-hydroxyisobutyrate dehydrogenase
MEIFRINKGPEDIMDLSKISGLGFVGLGAMGLPMAGHLASKLPESIQIFVFDINQASVDQLCNDHPKRVVKCSNAKEVADKSVPIKSIPARCG